MFSADDQKYLLRQLSRNQLVLFLGAGFSSNATNRSGGPIPLSNALAAQIWDLLEFDGDWDNTPLAEMYEALIRSGKTDAEISRFLDARLLVGDVPSMYDEITKPLWNRIYTTNVDDLVRTVYRRVAGAPSIEFASYPSEELRDRDQSLSSVQLIQLNGALPCGPREITFSTRQYARRSGAFSPLYQAFVGDYSYLPTIFVGTELNEPLFWQALETREDRRRGVSENRPRSFLVAPQISPARASNLASLNVVPIAGRVEDFLDWISSLGNSIPDKPLVLRETLPSVVELFERATRRKGSNPELEAFGAAFHVVPTTLSVSGDRSFFLLGATPRWEDIFRDLDAPRSITDDLIVALEAELSSDPKTEPHIYALLGTAGCGKSTILRRLARRLTQSGRLVFLTNSEQLPEPSTVVAALEQLTGKAVLLFDNADIALSYVGQLSIACKTLATPPAIAFTCRTSDYFRRGAVLQRSANVRELEIPNLERREISAIIEILEQNGLLGPLQGMSDRDRIREFEDRERAGKQLLVAMREATSGHGFDEIIEGEFNSLPSSELKLIYLFVALATDVGYRITPQLIIAASSLPPAEVLEALNRSLTGMILKTGPRLDQLVLRHRVIAGHIVNLAAPRTLLATAYKALVPALASATSGHNHRSALLALFRALLNHRTVFERFESDLSEARSIYDSVLATLRGEAHFWLQYGLLELWHGNLELAENYLRQAESLRPHSPLIQSGLGHLFLRQAVTSDSATTAFHLRHEGSSILKTQMGDEASPHPYHIYCSQRLSFARVWLNEPSKRKAEIEHLRDVMREGCQKFPHNRLLDQLRLDIEAEYLGLAVED